MEVVRLNTAIPLQVDLAAPMWASPHHCLAVLGTEWGLTPQEAQEQPVPERLAQGQLVQQSDYSGRE